MNWLSVGLSLITSYKPPGVVLCRHAGLVAGRDSSVGTATRYELEGTGIESWWERDFSVDIQTGPGTHPASYTIGTGSFPVVKLPGRCFEPPPHLEPRLKKK